MHPTALSAVKSAVVSVLDAPGRWFGRSTLLSGANADGLKTFRMGLLMYGKRPSASEVLRALRQA